MYSNTMCYMTITLCSFSYYYFNYAIDLTLCSSIDWQLILADYQFITDNHKMLHSTLISAINNGCFVSV